MILTQCPVCAAPLPDLTAKQCSRCKTRYCGPACQKKHWEEGGHANLCKKIKKGGGAEQYHANKKYAEAVGAATMACAEDTSGQTCYICTQALHWKTKEGLVRMCACRGTAGFVHVSCLAEQAKILMDEAEENRLSEEVFNERWVRWHSCSLCEQRHHGVVECALGWACWKTYVGRPERDRLRVMAMSVLGNGLLTAGHHEDALAVKEVELSMQQRICVDVEDRLVAQANLAGTYLQVGRKEQASRMLRDVYSGTLRLHGEEHRETLRAAVCYASSSISLQRFEEAKLLMRKAIPVARRVVDESDILMLTMRLNYAMALCNEPSATLDGLREAVATLEELERTGRRVLGGSHPTTKGIEGELRNARTALRAREGTKIK